MSANNKNFFPFASSSGNDKKGIQSQEKESSANTKYNNINI